ncbi:MAG: transcriptional repressor [Chloroflexi bacterium]|nr:transcriptional repressor [Chloroflexota bacterium]MBM3182404.1 transcriptional repressor [Chloroflexota bacterium]MBM4453161.1 transcriptional repressor [Chloroflexota bacterium]
MSCIMQLQQRGYRLTPQRMMVVDALHGGADHISAEEIHEQVRARYPYANISTVYRTLDLLKELGLVTEVALGDGRVRYHPAEKGHHHHLVCQKCGVVFDLPETAISDFGDVLSREYGFLADLRHLAIFGLCAECRN